MLNISKKSLATALVVGSIALTGSAFAGSVTESSNTWKAGFSADDGPYQYTRTIHVDADTGYKSGSAYVVRTTNSDFYVAGSTLDENGYEVTVVDFDPSQLETASDGQGDMRPESLGHAAPNYYLDDSDDRYHLVK